LLFVYVYITIQMAAQSLTQHDKSGPWPWPCGSCSAFHAFLASALASWVMSLTPPLPTRWWKEFDDVCFRFDVTPACDRQTDGQICHYNVALYT